jgi:hypothetical protein
MSARIVVNLAQGPAECAIDRGHDGGSWLSLRQGGEVVVVKLSPPSFEALQLMLAKEFGLPADGAVAPAREGCP